MSLFQKNTTLQFYQFLQIHFFDSSLANIKDGFHSELIAYPTQTTRIFEGGNRFFVRHTVTELVEACGGLKMMFFARRLFVEINRL